MQKEFTLNVPDEIWVNKWDTNRVENYTYNGPEVVYALITNKTENAEAVLSLLGTEPFTEEAFFDTTKYSIVEINANENTILAQLILDIKTNNYIYEYEDEENHDGSFYSKITNPRVSDYCIIVFNKSENEDEPSIKYEYRYIDDWKIPQKKEVEHLLEQLNHYKELDISLTLKEKINNYITQIEQYHSTIANSRSWKYDTFNMQEIPSAKSLMLSLAQINKTETGE